jgi:hypothetical protein
MGRAVAGEFRDRDGDGADLAAADFNLDLRLCELRRS